MISIDKVFLSRLSPMPLSTARRFAQNCVDRRGCLPMHIFINTTSLHPMRDRTRKFLSPGGTGIDQFNRNSSRLETLIIHGITPKYSIIGTLMLNRWKFCPRRLELRGSAAQCKTHSTPSLNSLTFINSIYAFSSTEITKQHDTETKLLSHNAVKYLPRVCDWFYTGPMGEDFKRLLDRGKFSAFNFTLEVQPRCV